MSLVAVINIKFYCLHMRALGDYVINVFSSLIVLLNKVSAFYKKGFPLFFCISHKNCNFKADEETIYMKNCKLYYS